MKTAIIFGSSGLIGNELFKTILLNNTYDKIKVFVRSIPLINNPKVEIIKTDFTNLEKYKDKIIGDDCYFCIGTTKKDTPNKDEYRIVENATLARLSDLIKNKKVMKAKGFKKGDKFDLKKCAEFSVEDWRAIRMEKGTNKKGID